MVQDTMTTMLLDMGLDMDDSIGGIGIASIALYHQIAILA